jgi:predicted nicotinamide N-methyase
MGSRRRKSGTPSLRIPLHTEVVRVAGRRYRLRRPRSAEELIDERDYERDERLPYWAELWPSALPLAEALAAMPLENLRVLELGCGLGLPSIVAAGARARALATDWYAEALQAVARNARAAGVEVPTLLVDWRDPPPELLAAAPFDLVVAADVLYEPRNADALLALLPRVVSPAGRALIADPRRPYAHHLIEPLVAAGWAHRREDVTLKGPIDEAGPVVHLHHLEPAPGA